MHLKRQQRGDSFTDLATERVPDSHFHPLDLSYVSSIAHKVLHGASCEGFLSLWQVQPQPVCLDVIGANDDDINPRRGAGITFDPRGQGEVIRDDWVREMNCFKFFFIYKIQSEVSATSETIPTSLILVLSSSSRLSVTF